MGLGQLAQIQRFWPEVIANDDLAAPALIRDIETARAKLMERLDLAELV